MPEVLEFEDFQTVNGPLQGWHPDDHAEFLRILQAAKGDQDAFEASVISRLFHLDSAQIKSHIRYPPPSYRQNLVCIVKFFGTGDLILSALYLCCCLETTSRFSKFKVIAQERCKSLS